MERTTWVEVSREALARNLASVAGHAGVAVCAVVKSNAYGHGLVEAARAFASAGAAMLGVSRLEEARALRGAGIDAPVLIMMPVPDPGEAVKLDCDIMVGSSEGIAGVPSGARVHLKVDTGMGRLGIQPHDTMNAARAIREHASLEAIWTHFADAAGDSGPRQLETFASVVGSLRSGGMKVVAHAANSAGVLALPDARFDMVRVGTLLYGQDPPGARAPWPHADTFAWYARVASVRTVPPGTHVGYGSEWTAKRASRLATIPVGYADGYLVQPHARTPSGRSVARTLAGALRTADRVVSFDGVEAPVVGRVAMQAITADVTDLPDVRAGTIARVPARRLMVSAAIERVYT
jgi:alanine racemase